MVRGIVRSKMWDGHIIIINNIFRVDKIVKTITRTTVPEAGDNNQKGKCNKSRSDS